MRHFNVQTASFQVSGDPEVFEVAEAFSHALCQLEDTVHGLDGGVGESRLHVSEDSGQMFFDRARESFERLQPGSSSPSHPPLKGRQVIFREDILQGFAQGHGAPEFRVGLAELVPHVQLLLCARPGVSAQRPETAVKIGSRTAQVLTHRIQSFPSQLHNVEEIEDNAGFGKGSLCSGDEGGAHVHDDLGDLLRGGPVFWHLPGELFEGIATAAIDHEQEIVAVGIKNHSNVTVPPPGTGFVHHDAGDFRPVLLLVGLCDIVIEHPPKPGVVLPEMAGGRLHAHLLTEKQNHGFHHQRKTAAFPGPRNLGQQNPVLVALGARHTGDEKGLVLPEVEMPPLLFHRVMDRTPLPALRARKARPSFKIQPQAQPTSFDIHFAFDHFPPAPESESHPKQIVGVHSRKILHARKRSASPSFRWPQALIQVPPERLPRRAVRGLGAHSPHQTGSFHPFNSARSRKTSIQVNKQKQHEAAMARRDDMARKWRESERILGILRPIQPHPEPVNHEIMSDWYTTVEKRSFVTVTDVNRPSEWFHTRFPEIAEKFGPALLEEVKDSGPFGISSRCNPVLLNKDFLAAALGGDRGLGHQIAFYPPEKSFYFYDPRVLAFCPATDEKIQLLASNLLVKAAEACSHRVNTRPLLDDFRKPAFLRGIVKLARTILQAENTFFEGEHGKVRYIDGKLVNPSDRSTCHLFVKKVIAGTPGALLPMSDARTKYIEFCRLEQLPEMAPAEFKKSVSKIVEETYSKKLRHDIPDQSGRHQHGWAGLSCLNT